MNAAYICLIPLALFAGCAAPTTSTGRAQSEKIKQQNARYFAGHPQDRPSRAEHQSLEERLSRLKIGMQEGIAISVMGVAPVRTNQLHTATGDQHVLVYAQSQFWTGGQAFLQGMARESGSPYARDGVVSLSFQNHALTAIQRSDY